jgi:zinc transport system ATP-binding protein
MEKNKPLIPVAITLDRVTVNRNGTSILNSVTATVPKGGVTGLIGPNGSGKTTLLMAILGQIGFSGKILFHFDGERRPRVGYVPQRFQFDRGMPMSVLDFMTLDCQRMPLWFGVSSRHRKKVMEMLAIVKAEQLVKRRLGVLSGGELQRVLLALALREDPELLILDEPVAGVDVVGEQLFCELLEQLRKDRGFTQLMVSHNLSVVLAHATHAILLNRRIICQGNPREVLKPEMLMATYGMHMELPEFSSAHEYCPHCTPLAKFGGKDHA